MADKQISQLPRADGVNITDLFVLSQSGAAMSITGQKLINGFAAALDAHGGITSIDLVSSSGLVDTYKITYADTEADDTFFTVTNGKGISSIAKTGTSGLVDTYTITYNNGSPTTFTVTNGAKGDTGAQTNVYIKWSVNEPISSADMIDTPSNYIGICAQIEPPTSYLQYKWYKYKGEQGIQGETGDYIEPVMSYGTSTAAATEPSTWYNSPTSISYVAGNFIWKKTEYVLHAAQTVQATETEIIGYIGQNGSGSGSVNQITFNGTVFTDDGTGNVNMTVDAADVDAIADPTTKSDGQVLTYDSAASAWVAATPSTGSVNSVNNVYPTAGTSNIALYATAIPMSSSDATTVAAAIPVASSSTPLADITSGDVGTGTAWAREDHRHPLNVDATLPADLGTAAVGTATAYARRDHVHNPPANIGTFSVAGVNWTRVTGTSNWYANVQSSGIDGHVKKGSKITLLPNAVTAYNWGNYGIRTMMARASSTTDDVLRIDITWTAAFSGQTMPPSISDVSFSSEVVDASDITAGTWTFGEPLLIMRPESSPYELLWTNENPANSFAAQTVSLDLTKYNMILMYCRNFATGDSNFGIVSQTCLKGVVNSFQITASSNNRNGRRFVTPSDSGVDISGCTYNGSTNNNYCVPYYIYGIR